MRKGKPSAGGGGRRIGRRLVVLAVVLLASAAVVAGVRLAGDTALGRLAREERYRVRVADIACEPPPGVDRATFLNEVRYVGDLPETVRGLDPADRRRVAAALAAHPWVEAVAGVDAEPGGVVRARLEYRVPVLAVEVADGPPRLVDVNGVLLPAAGVPPGLPRLLGKAKRPATPAGKVWDEPAVQRAIELAQVYRPAKLESVPAGWRLTTPDGQTLIVPR